MSHDVITAIVRAIEVCGVGVIVVGLGLAAVLAASELRRAPRGEVYQSVRRRVSQAILLGLELFVAADILQTVSERPSLQGLAVLAAIIGIRTFLSFTLEIEVSRQLPWRAPR